jgi:diguanylate cyclase (GGDEF)-like protein
LPSGVAGRRTGGDHPARLPILRELEEMNGIRFASRAIGAICRSISVGLADLDSLKITRAALFLLSIPSGYLLCGEPPGARQGVLPTLTTAAAVHGLSPLESKRQYPVHLRAVCVVCFPGWHGFFVNDGSTGVYVETKNQILLTDAIHTGSMLEVEGVTGPGEFSPIVDQASVRVLGEGALPSARHVGLDRLSTGIEDGQWIEVEGTVRSADTSNTMLTLVVASGQLEVAVMTPRYDEKQYPRLIDARVRVRGTAGPIFNQRRQLIGVNMYTPSLAEFRVLEPAPPDPFVLPARTVRSAFEYTPGTGPDRRVRIRGTVTARWPGKAFFITDGIQGASVLSAQTTPLEPGDVVDVIGFAVLGGYTPTLHEAVFRKLGSESPPAPRPVTAKEALSGNFDADLVRIDARLIQLKRTTDQYTFLLDSGGAVFSAILQADESDHQLDGLRDASRLQVTGVCTVTETQASRHFRVPTAFQILLRSPRDAVLLEASSWWTTKRILVLLGICLLMILGGTLWVVSLKKRVQERTETIRATLEATADGILVVDSAGKIVAHNQKFDAMWAVQEPIGKLIDHRLLSDFVKSRLKDPVAFISTFATVYADPKVKTDDLLEFKDGRVFERHSEPQTVKGRNVGRVWGFRDVTELRERNRQLQELARMDGLTGIRNRRSIFEFLSTEMARAQRGGDSLTVIMADLDGFKKINDYFGHVAGDAVLRETAQRLRSCIRPSDAVGRYGGEEFLIVLPGCDQDSARSRAEELRCTVEGRPVAWEMREIGITCSFGVAGTRDGIYDLRQLLPDADAALYRAKQKGRNRVSLADADGAGAISSDIQAQREFAGDFFVGGKSMFRI